MKIFFGTLAVLTFIAAILAGLYVSLWLCLIGGLIQAIEAAKATPLDTVHLVYGIFRVLCTSLAGMTTFGVCTAIAGLFGIIAASKD